jgi:hypothetical protein
LPLLHRRPIFATVLSIVITLAGAARSAPLAMYPPIAPTVNVCQYPRAAPRWSPRDVAADRAAGQWRREHDNMSPVPANDGTSLTVTFKHGIT